MKREEAGLTTRPRAGLVTALSMGLAPWLVSHIRAPLYREGYALALSAGITSLLGFAYWIVAARAYSPSVVGLNSALISVMTFLAGISQLNLASAAVRFLPAMETGAKRFVVSIYLVALSSAVAACLVFLAGVNVWTPTLGFVREAPQFALGFTISAMAWAAFNLQHSILTGLRRAVWVPLENAAYSFSKLGLLAVLAALLPRWGIFVSWTAALAVALIPTVTFIFARFIPRHTVVRSSLPAAGLWRSIARYAAADYAGGLCWQAAITLVPIIVIQQSGPAANAYFSLSWLMVMPLYVVSASMGSSLVVSGIVEAAGLTAIGHRVLLQTWLIVVPVAAILIVGAPVILRVFGADYARSGTSVLRLLALSTVPGAFNTLYINMARVQRRMARVVGVYLSQSALVLVLALTFLKLYGLPGVGVAWVVSQSAVALAVALLIQTSGRPQLLGRRRAEQDGS